MKKWSEEEAVFADSYTGTIAQLADELGRTYRSVKNWLYSTERGRLANKRRKQHKGMLTMLDVADTLFHVGELSETPVTTLFGGKIANKRRKRNISHPCEQDSECEKLPDVPELYEYNPARFEIPIYKVEVEIKFLDDTKGKYSTLYTEPSDRKVTLEIDISEKLNYPLLAHECYHIVMYVYSLLDEVPTFEAHEPAAYLLQYVYERVLKFYIAL